MPREVGLRKAVEQQYRWRIPSSAHSREEAVRTDVEPLLLEVGEEVGESVRRWRCRRLAVATTQGPDCRQAKDRRPSQKGAPVERRASALRPHGFTRHRSELLLERGTKIAG